MQFTKVAFYPSRVGLPTFSNSQSFSSLQPSVAKTSLSQDVFQQSARPKFGQKNKLHEVAEDISSWDRDHLQKLIEENPDALEERDDKRLTPLLRAALSGNLPVVRYLTKHTEANPTAVDPQTDDTIIHLATRAAAEPGAIGEAGLLTLDYLIRNKRKLGLDINARNSSNRTPKDVASRFEDLRRYIQSKGGRNWTTLAFMPSMANEANAMTDESSGDEAEAIVKYKSYG